MTLMSLMATLGMDVSGFRSGASQARQDMGGLGSASEEMAETVKASAKEIDGLSEKFSKLASGAGTALTAAFTVPLAAIGAAGLKAGMDLDSAFDSIRTKTGQTGAALEGLQGSFRTVFGNVASNAEDVGLAIASIAQRTGQTGPALEALSTQFLNLARVSGTDLKGAIENATRLFGDWGIEATKQGGTLDFLYRTTQTTGVGFDKLAAGLVQFGAPLRQLGFDMDTAAVMLGKFEKEGVNTELVLGAMKAALGKFGKAGDEPAEAFARVVQAIKNTDIAHGNLIATQLVGIRRSADFAAAVREGRLDFEDMTRVIASGSDTINRAAGDTDDFAESWQRFKNTMTLALEPLGKALFDILNDLTPKLQAIVGVVANVAKVFGDLDPTVQTAIIGFGAVVAGIGPMLLLFGQVVSQIPAMQAGLSALGTSFTGLASAATIAAGAIAAVALFESLRENAKANAELSQTTADLVKQTATLEASLKAHGITVDRGKMSIEEYNTALNKAARSTPDYQAKLEAAGKAQKETADSSDKLHASISGGLGKWDQHKEKLTDAEKEHKKLEAAIKSTTEHYDLMMSKFKGATWDFDQFKEFVRQGGNANAAMREMEAQIVKLRQKFGDDMPASIRAMIVQLTMATSNFEKFKQQLDEEKLEVAFEKLNAELAKTHEKFKGIPPLITEMAKAVADNEVEFEKLSRAVQSVSKPITELPDVIQETVNATARAAQQSGAIWRRLGDDIKDIFSSLKSSIAANIGGSIWDSIIGNNDNQKLDEQAAELRANLAERAAEWQRYQDDVSAAILEIQAEHAAELEQQIADLRAGLDEKREEYDAYVTDVNAKLGEFRAKQDEALAAELATLASNLQERADEWAAYQVKAAEGLAAFTAKQDAELNEQRNALLANLGERATEWQAYQEKAASGLAEFTRKHNAKLAEELAELNANLAERAREWEKYQADAAKHLNDFRAAQAEKLAEELADLRSNLADKQADYYDYVNDVNEKLATLNETNTEKLAEDLERLNKSFAEKQQAYGKYVEDVNQKLSRIGEDFKEQIDDERRGTQRSIDDKRRAYDREEREINERMARELAKGEKANQQQVADWKRSLLQKREDLDIYVARQEADLAEFIDDHQRALLRQTADLENALAQRAKTEYEARLAHEEQIEAVTTAAARELARQTGDLTDSLKDRTADWVAYQAEIAGKMATAQTNHDTAVANEERKVRESLAERQAAWVEYQAEIARKITATRAAHDAELTAEQQAVATSLMNRQAAWQAYQEEIARKIAAAQEKHDTAIATEAGKVAASLAEREAAWERYRAEIERKIESAHTKHDNAIAAEELKVARSLAAREAEWVKYQASVAAKIEAATLKHDEEQAKEVADLIARMNEKREEYDKYVADIKLKLEQIERDHTTVWGRIKDSLVNTLSDAGRAITQTLFSALTDTLFDQLKNSTVWQSISTFLGGIFSTIARTITGMFGSIGSSIASALGIGGGSQLPGVGSPERGGIPGIPSGAISSGGGEGGSTDLLPPVVTAFMQIAGYLQGRRQEQDIARIEVSTREVAEIWKSSSGPMFYFSKYLPKLEGMESFNYQVIQPSLSGIETEIVNKGLDIIRAVNAAKDVLIQAKDYVHDVVFSFGETNTILGRIEEYAEQIRDAAGGVKTSAEATEEYLSQLSTETIESLLTGMNNDLSNKLSSIATNTIGITSGIGSAFTTALTPVVSTLNTINSSVLSVDPDSMFASVMSNFENNLKNKLTELDPRPLLSNLQIALSPLSSMSSSLQTLSFNSSRVQPAPVNNTTIVNMNGIQQNSIASSLRSFGVPI